jgi:hypothetical protein
MGEWGEKVGRGSRMKFDLRRGTGVRHGCLTLGLRDRRAVVHRVNRSLTFYWGGLSAKPMASSNGWNDTEPRLGGL